MLAPAEQPLDHKDTGSNERRAEHHRRRQGERRTGDRRRSAVGVECERRGRQRRARPSRLRELTERELQEVLAAHRDWKKSNGQSGRRASLRAVRLAAADLRSANLSDAVLERADLSGARLEGAYLTGANLKRTNLRKAQLTDATLIRANMVAADLDAACLKGAYLTHADLRGASLKNASMADTTLIRANLAIADLESADLTRAVLAGAKLKRTTLVFTQLWGANLKHADLSEVSGLTTEQLAAANLAGTAIADSLKIFDGLEQVERIVAITRPIFLLMLLGCLYAFATIASTTTMALLSNAPAQLLPNWDTAIPTAGYYWVAPILLFSLFLYTNLYLQAMWQALAKLPAIFHDGRHLDERVSPWLLTSLVRAHVRWLHTHRTPLSRIKVCTLVTLTWMLVPFTLACFWWTYLVRHDPNGSYMHLTLLALSIWVALAFYRLAHDTLSGRARTTPTFGDWLKQRSTYYCALPGVAVFVLGSVLYEGVVNGTPQPDAPPRGWQASWWPPKTLADVRLKLFSLDLEEEGIRSVKPLSWTEEATPEERRSQIALVRGVRLANQDLSYARGENAFLARADLRAATLHGVDLGGAVLIGADLSAAELHDAHLENADLRDANMRRSVLHSATLRAAQLQGADLSGADLSGADLAGALLNGADLTGANLAGARLAGVRLDRRENGPVTTYRKLSNIDVEGIAFLEIIPVKSTGAGEHGGQPDSHQPGGPVFDNTDLRNADLRGVDFTQIDLRSADFTGADLEGANFRGVDLRAANLTSANLTRADLTGADLRSAKIFDATLVRATLQRANLRGADLKGAGLKDADLQGAVLKEAQLSDAAFRNANLQGADFEGAVLERASFIDADLRAANLDRTNLAGAILLEADLRGARLVQANLLGADLRRANLENTDFSRAYLEKTDLRGAVLDQASFDGADLLMARVAADAFRRASAFTNLFIRELQREMQTVTPDAGAHTGCVSENALGNGEDFAVQFFALKSADRICQLLEQYEHLPLIVVASRDVVNYRVITQPIPREQGDRLRESIMQTGISEEIRGNPFLRKVSELEALRR